MAENLPMKHIKLQIQKADLSKQNHQKENLI